MDALHCRSLQKREKKTNTTVGVGAEPADADFEPPATSPAHTHVAPPDVKRRCCLFEINSFGFRERKVFNRVDCVLPSVCSILKGSFLCIGFSSSVRPFYPTMVSQSVSRERDRETERQKREKDGYDSSNLVSSWLPPRLTPSLDHRGAAERRPSAPRLASLSSFRLSSRRPGPGWRSRPRLSPFFPCLAP